MYSWQLELESSIILAALSTDLSPTCHLPVTDLSPT
jgi:hypothetical protein